MQKRQLAEPVHDVIVCGSLHLDIVVRADAIPRLDETAVGQTWAEICGGKGGNQAVQAARQGAKTAFIGKVGRDGFGDKLLANLDRAGVDRSAVAIDEATGSGMSVAIVDAQGNYGAVIVSGANLAIAPDAFASAWQRLGGARVLILQNEVPETINHAAAVAAKSAGALVVFNAAPARASLVALMEHVDILVLNRVEAGMMSGLAVDSVATARAALTVLTTGGQPRNSTLVVVITLGGDGLVVSQPGAEAVEIKPIPVAVASTHGAGDCFVGVLASSLAKGEDVLTSCRRANAAASSYVSGSTSH